MAFTPQRSVAQLSSAQPDIVVNVPVCSQKLEQVTHSLVYAFNDRKDKKGDFRRLWIQRINAGTRANGMTYNRFIQGLKSGGVEVDRRILSELATNDPAAFAALVEVARKHVVNA